MGIIQFSCAVQQIEKVTVALQQFKVDVDGLVGSRIMADFKLKAPTVFGKGEHEVVRYESKNQTAAVEGKFTRYQKAKTTFKYEGKNEASVTLDTSLECLFKSSLKISIYEHEEEAPPEEIKEVKPKLSG